MNDDDQTPALDQAAKGTDGWRKAVRHQWNAAPDHADFYALAGEIVNTLHALDDLTEILARHVAGYAQGRPVYDDTRTVDPAARLGRPRRFCATPAPVCAPPRWRPTGSGRPSATSERRPRHEPAHPPRPPRTRRPLRGLLRRPGPPTPAPPPALHGSPRPTRPGAVAGRGPTHPEGRRMSRRTVTPHHPDRNSRSEPFEIFTRPQRSRPARLLGLAVRRRAEITVLAGLWLAWSWLTDRVDPLIPDPVPPAGMPPDVVPADPLPGSVAGIALAVLAGVLLVVPPTRRYLHRRALAVLTRHRLRSVFVQRRIMNWTGNLPVLLWSRPTPVGERVWLLLRAGIDAVDIERNLPYVASGCFARNARVSVVRSMTALVMVDVIRRDPLTRRTPAAQPAPAAQPVPTPVPALRVVRTEKGA